MELGFVLCRKRTDGCLHLHIVDPDDADTVHGDDVHVLEDPPDMATFLSEQVNEGQV